jgi:RNA polymerase sigma-70 factor (ECF subfamily)
VLREARTEAARVLRDRTRADDAAQEAAIRAWRYAHACRDARRPGPWVRAIARREALRIAARGAPPAGESATEAEDHAAGELDRVVAERVDVRRALALTTDVLDRRLLAHRYWEGRSEAEIAALTGLPVGTVKVRLHRARRRLRHQLER